MLKVTTPFNGTAPRNTGNTIQWLGCKEHRQRLKVKNTCKKAELSAAVYQIPDIGGFSFASVLTDIRELLGILRIASKVNYCKNIFLQLAKLYYPNNFVILFIPSNINGAVPVATTSTNILFKISKLFFKILSLGFPFAI